MSLEPICLYIRTSFTGCLEGAHAWTLSFLLHSRGEKATSIRGHLEHFPFFQLCAHTWSLTAATASAHRYTPASRELHRAVNILKKYVWRRGWKRWKTFMDYFPVQTAKWEKEESERHRTRQWGRKRNNAAAERGGSEEAKSDGERKGEIVRKTDSRERRTPNVK